jgi:ferredoxin-NADP reductase/cytochrome c2
MLQTTLSAVLGLVFIIVGAVNVWLIFHSSSRLKDKGASARLVRGHRIGGYIFIMIFCVMTYYMILRVKDVPDELSARPMLHMVLAMLMVPLLFVKVLIARYYKTYYSVLMPLGLIVFTLAFVLVAMTAGPYILRKATIKDIPLESVQMGEQKIDVEASQALMQRKCSRCHNLDRIVSSKKDARGWLTTINRMRALPGAGISDSDGATILAYLVSQNSVEAQPNGEPTPQGEQTAGKSLVDTHCNRCHDLDRIYKTSKSADEWRDTVTRMVAYSSGNDGLFRPGDDKAIIDFLAATQTPEAVQKRSAMVADAAKAGKSLVPPQQMDMRTAAAAPAGANLPAVAVIVLVSAFFGALMLRRPGTTGQGVAAMAVSSAGIAAAPQTALKAPLPLAAEPKKTTMILQLARIEPQTRDARTLRFLVPEGDRFWARPGQFITFNFLIDGKKVVRSYSICSSPTQTGYIEITPKRVENGSVSVFLNEKAQLGLTVEAKGPSGQFYFDEAVDRKIALIAAGSGITPMISILRYIDDRCLATNVSLLYSARTSKDIIFEKELQRLKERLDNFKYAVTLTKPDGDWQGARGRLNRALIEANVNDLSATTFFLCGPKDFMESAREMLLAMGVNEARIKRESFGGPRANVDIANAPTATSAEGQVEFARARKVCQIPAGKSLLETAEMNGVNIPFSCRQGQCGTCATRCLEGAVEMDAEDGLDPDLKASGYVLTCVGHAKGKVKLDA